MRIVGGKFKRRIISTPGNLDVRPTTDLAKESLFNILNNLTDLDDIHVIDLFSGTGNMAYEFVSRGASRVLAVDISHRNVKFIRQTAAQFGMEELQVVQSDVFRFLDNAFQPADIIFADPPYAMENSGDIVEKVFSGNLLKPGGFLIIEHPRSFDFSGHENFHSHRKYGKVNFTLFQAREPEAD